MTDDAVAVASPTLRAIARRADLGRVVLAEVIAAVLPAPRPGERYHVRGLTELWLAGLARKSSHTHRSYRLALARWLDYCLRAGINPLAARRADVDDWVIHDLAGLGPQTVNARLSGVKSWYRYLISNGVPSGVSSGVSDGLDTELDLHNPVDDVDRPDRRHDTTDTAWLDPASLNALLTEANRRLAAAQRAVREAATAPPPSTAPDGTAPDDIASERAANEIVVDEAVLRREVAARDLAVLRVLATTAVRSAAVQDAAVADVRGWTGGHRILIYHPKAHDRTVRAQVVLPPIAAAAVDHYLQLRADRLGVEVEALTGPAFATIPYRGRAGNGPLSTHSLIDMIRAVAAGAEIPNAAELVVHSLRHSSATLAARHRPLGDVQAFLDHVDPATTAIYAHADTSLSNSVAYTIASHLDDDAAIGDERLLIDVATLSRPVVGADR